MRVYEREMIATWKSYSREYWWKDSPYDLVARADQTVPVDRYTDEGYGHEQHSQQGRYRPPQIRPIGLQGKPRLDHVNA